MIPEQLDGHPVTEIGEKALDSCETMYEVSLCWEEKVLLRQFAAKYMDQIIYRIAAERIKKCSSLIPWNGLESVPLDSVRVCRKSIFLGI